ncbi:MAG: LysM peptidoglycan-binding domain-containing protein [Ilumatobacteraceae bacterium]|nr:LysM peptidoglycan-binding domain-containing protein [Ilumatobacteraceae bacterium]
MTVIRRFFVTAAISASAFAIATPAQAADPAMSYVVQPGDYLLRIASDHSVALKALLQENDLTSESLILPGQRLTIPAGGTAPVAPTTAAPAPAAPATGPSYTVVSGDALSTIANRHGVRLAALLQANDLSLTSVIMPGHQLTIPGGGTARAAAPAPATPAPAAPTQPAAPAELTYTVVSGDALSIIAARHGVSLGALLQTNDLSLDTVIFPGRVLNIPAGGTAPAPAPSAPAAVANAPSSSRVDTVVNYARAQVGKDYKFFTAGPDTFDCSGLTLAAYEQVGVSLVHYSAAQAMQGTAVDFANEPIKPGDLIFQNRRGSKSINHVGIAVSATQWVHASDPGNGVVITSIPATGEIASVRRYIDG